MNILAIDTTTKTACVGIKKENIQQNTFEIIQRSISNEITHSEKLLPLIDSTLKEASLKLSDISLLASLSGPGSFTGIRIGLSTIKAFAQVKGLNIFAMTTLEAICYTSYLQSSFFKSFKPIYVLSLIDAKNDRIYFSLYKISRNTIGKITIKKISEMSNNLIKKASESILHILENLDSTIPIIVAGDCSQKFKNEILDVFLNPSNIENHNIKIQNNNNIYFVDLYPTPKDLISAYENLEDISNYMFDSYTLDATYARLSQAERVKNENN
ncbi:MAG: tRNA (adenosine(37)-N6)-threonylcarbamoyltransferase complex dimerization subunit type 1 TsaB [Clostridia bacterium]